LRDYRIWWALFVFFAAIGVVVIQYRYRRWRRASRLLAGFTGVRQTEQARLVRLEGWRLVFMTASLLVMTALVFALFLGASAAVLGVLRVLALLTVLGLVLLSFRS
jgi:hypothetical protein